MILLAVKMRAFRPTDCYGRRMNMIQTCFKRLLLVGLLPLIGGCITSTSSAPSYSGPSSSDSMQLLVMGGGGSSRNNQVSLESNVLYMRRLLNDLEVDAHRDELFADGNEGNPTLQTRDDKMKVPVMNQLLSMILGPGSNLRYVYRPHELGPVAGAPEVKTIEAYFDATAARSESPESLMVYFTGHGGRGLTKAAHNTSIYLWGRYPYRVDAFCKQLDKLDPEMPVMLLMVQCYSGGYANVIFKEGDPAKGLSDHARFGFYSTVHDRTAAGCTPDINEANYREYSTYFLEALWGTTRLGKRIKRPDFNGDGRLSFDEAHAYALIMSTTIDVSIKTSDAFLRHFSKMEGEDADLLDLSSYESILARASVIDAAVLEAISEQLELDGDDRLTEARKKADEIKAERDKLEKEKKILKLNRDKKRLAVRGELTKRWPPLMNPWHPELQELLEKEGGEIIGTMTTHPDFAQFDKMNRSYFEKEKKRLDLNREWARAHAAGAYGRECRTGSESPVTGRSRCTRALQRTQSAGTHDPLRPTAAFQSAVAGLCRSVFAGRCPVSSKPLCIFWARPCWPLDRVDPLDHLPLSPAAPEVAQSVHQVHLVHCVDQPGSPAQPTRLTAPASPPRRLCRSGR